MTTIEPWLREILRCPQCRSELRDGTGPTGGPELVCVSAQCALAYRLDDGIPVLLVDEARAPGDDDGSVPDTTAPSQPQA